MTKKEMIELLRSIRAAVEEDEEQFTDEFAENVIEKIDAAIHTLEN